MGKKRGGVTAKTTPKTRGPKKLVDGVLEPGETMQWGGIEFTRGNVGASDGDEKKEE